jgi:hypothetical protein
MVQKAAFSMSVRRRAGGENEGHHEETYEEFTQRFVGDTCG